MALGNRHGVTAQRGSYDSARLYIFITTPDENFATTSGLVNEMAASAKNKLLSDDTLLGQWGPRIKELVVVGCDEESANNLGTKVDIRPVCGLPMGYTWEHKSGTTLIGDAAHLMPPSGEGVNIAMWDAVMLSQAIIKAHETVGQDAASFQNALNPVIKEFEGEMAVRAKEAAEQSLMLNETMFAEDGAAAMAKWFKSFGPSPE
jgi:2-polyprenyl-6-methoxyphenol hydroxylase-like FAD-dependent oxidoreductase